VPWLRYVGSVVKFEGFPSTSRQISTDFRGLNVQVGRAPNIFGPMPTASGLTTCSHCRDADAREVCWGAEAMHWPSTHSSN
jgi:hypothetical protein